MEKIPAHIAIIMDGNGRWAKAQGKDRCDGHIEGVVSVKACTSLRAAYTPISAEICNTATPGAAGTVLQDMPYKKRPSPLYPFEEITEADIVNAVCYR